MKYVVAAVLVLHGAIHLMGFAKSFGFAELPALKLPLSRAWGIAWLLTAALLIAAAGMRLGSVRVWWTAAAAGLVLSQATVIVFWADAKFGTLANLLLVVPVLVGFGTWRFEARVRDAASELRQRQTRTARPVVQTEDLGGLPPVVRVWLERSGVVGRPRTRSLHITQRGQMQTAPDGRWMPFRAEQWFLTETPAFTWVVDVDAAPFVHLAGRDTLLDGRGAMRIELLSIVPVVDARGSKIDQGAAVRYLAETMWFPSAALEAYVRWSPNDERSAYATMRVGDDEVRGLFVFDERGDVIRFEARRYRDESLEDWQIDNDPDGFRVFHGVRVPARSRVSWKSGDGQSWTWLRLELESVDIDGEIVPR